MNALIPITLCTLLISATWIIFSTIRRYLVAKLQASLQAKLLDRLDSTEAIHALVSTEEGRKLISSLRLDQDDRGAPFRSILLGAQASIVLSVLGLAFLLLHARKILPDDGAVVLGTVPLALGIGFGVAAAATYLMSRNFGLLGETHRS